VASERLVVKIGQTERVVYEDFDFAALRSKELESFARDFAVRLYGPEAQDELDHFLDRVCVVGDDVMRVLARVGMEITARNRIGNETRTVEKGALWTEESLPAESVLTGLVMVTPLRGEDPATLVGHVRELCRGVLQFGGKSTIGRGLCRMEVV
jgi:CRISPR-associated protein Cmr4